MKTHRLVIVIATIIIVVVAAMATFLPFSPKTLARVVPVERVILLLACLEENLCQVPRYKVKMDDHEYWAVRLLDRDGELNFLTDGTNLKVLVSIRKGGKEEVVMVEDIGTGIVARLTYMDATGNPTVLEEGNSDFAKNFGWAQSLYFDMMEVAAKKVIPTIRAIRPTT